MLKPAMLLMVLIFFTLCSANADTGRVISTMPSITQVFTYLDKEEKLVGISNYCHLKGKRKIGTSLELNIEKVLSLKPDLVLFSPFYKNNYLKVLKKAKVNYKIIPQNSLSTIQDSIELVGNLLLPRKKVEQILEEFKSAFEKYKNKKPKFNKALLVLGEESKFSKFRAFYAAAAGSVYHDILTKLSLKNLIQGVYKYNLKITPEKFLTLNPDLIIHLTNSEKEKNVLEKQWNYFLKKTGLQNTTKIILLKNPAYFVPGPYIYKLYDEIGSEVYDDPRS